MNYGSLKAAVRRDIRDPDSNTFEDADVADFIESAITELSYVAPELFQEDIEPVADQLDYPLRADVFSSPVPEIEVKRIEVWDGSLTPMQYVARLRAKSEQRVDTSFNGWENWGGVVSFPNGVVDALVPDQHLIRVWGYSPYAIPTDDSDEPTWSHEVEQAIRVFCRIATMELLLADRNLFSQWQTRSGNTDMSPAALYGELATARSMWRTKTKALGRTRTGN